MRRLVCACVVRKPPNTGFLTLRPISCNAIFWSADQQHLYTFYQKCQRVYYAQTQPKICGHADGIVRQAVPNIGSTHVFACITCTCVAFAGSQHEATSIARATPQLLMQNMYDGYSCIFYLIIPRGLGGYRFDVVCPSF